MIARIAARGGDRPVIANVIPQAQDFLVAQARYPIVFADRACACPPARPCGMMACRPAEARPRVRVASMRMTAGAAIFGLCLLPVAVLAQRAGPTAGVKRGDYIQAEQARAEKLAGRRFDQIDTGRNGVLEPAEIAAWRAAHRRAQRAGAATH